MFNESIIALTQLLLCMSGVLALGLAITLVVAYKIKRQEQAILEYAADLEALSKHQD